MKDQFLTLVEKRMDQIPQDKLVRHIVMLLPLIEQEQAKAHPVLFDGPAGPPVPRPLLPSLPALALPVVVAVPASSARPPGPPSAFLSGVRAAPRPGAATGGAVGVGGLSRTPTRRPAGNPGVGPRVRSPRRAPPRRRTPHPHCARGARQRGNARPGDSPPEPMTATRRSSPSPARTAAVSSTFFSSRTLRGHRWKHSAHHAGVVHVCESMDVATAYTTDLACDRIPDRPFVLVGQMNKADPTRSPAGTETVWAYTHVPREPRADGRPHQRGVGVIGPPVRINCRPEITEITVVSTTQTV